MNTLSRANKLSLQNSVVDVLIPRLEKCLAFPIDKINMCGNAGAEHLELMLRKTNDIEILLRIRFVFTKLENFSISASAGLRHVSSLQLAVMCAKASVDPRWRIPRTFWSALVGPQSLALTFRLPGVYESSSRSYPLDHQLLPTELVSHLESLADFVGEVFTVDWVPRSAPDLLLLRRPDDNIARLNIWLRGPMLGSWSAFERFEEWEGQLREYGQDKEGEELIEFKARYVNCLRQKCFGLGSSASSKYVP